MSVCVRTCARVRVCFRIVVASSCSGPSEPNYCVVSSDSYSRPPLTPTLPLLPVYPPPAERGGGERPRKSSTAKKDKSRKRKGRRTSKGLGGGEEAASVTSTSTKRRKRSHDGSDEDAASSSSSSSSSDGDKLLSLVLLQAFGGSFKWSPALVAVLSLPPTADTPTACSTEQWATALVIAYFEEVLGDRRAEWELVAGKARVWLAASTGDATALLTAAKGALRV